MKWKKRARRIALDVFCALMLVLTLLLLTVLAAEFLADDRLRRISILCVSVPLLGLIAIILAVVFVCKLKLYLAVRNAGARTKEITVVCRSVRFFSRSSGRSWYVIGAYLKDDEGHKFIAFFTREYDWSYKPVLRDKLTREMTLQKYCGSCVVDGVEKYL